LKKRLKKDSKMRRDSFGLAACLAVSVLTGLALCSIAAPAGSPLAYTTLNFGTDETFLTGIRGNNIVGNYVIPPVDILHPGPNNLFPQNTYPKRT
jgi:hypothetical protein